jgi:uncharacterized membrane protein
MAIRSFRERAVQTLLYEAGGIAVATPLYDLIFGAGAAESLTLMVVLSVILLIWIPLFNWLFDLVEWRLTRRPSSERPHRMRALHAFGMEATSVVVTVPAIMLVGGHGFWEALAVDIGLSVLYVVYAYVFHILYDRFRPVTSGDRSRDRLDLGRTRE